MEYGPGELQTLSRSECVELLASREVGRIAVIADGHPMIFPVNYALDGEVVVFRTDPGTKLDHAGLDRVAFEVDEVDRLHRAAWSVVVTGTGRELTDALDATSVRERELPLESFVMGPKEHWVRIVNPTITGRRVVHTVEASEELGA